jgi:hypothetical protein
MPDLSDLLKRGVGDVPDFDVAALIARRRRQRRVQAAVGAGAAIVMVGSVVAVVSNSNNHSNQLVSTRNGSSDSAQGSTTTQYPYLYDTTAPRPTDFPNESTTTLPTDTSVTGPPPTSPPTVTKPEPPQPGDFTGSLTATPTTIRVGQSPAFVQLTIHNSTGHTVEPAMSNMPTSVATVCGRFGPDGKPEARLISEFNNWFIIASSMNPGDEAARSFDYSPVTDDVGTITCEAAIVSSADEYAHITFVARITAIPAVTITVQPGDVTVTTGTAGSVQTTVPSS